MKSFTEITKEIRERTCNDYSDYEYEIEIYDMSMKLRFMITSMKTQKLFCRVLLKKFIKNGNISISTDIQAHGMKILLMHN